MCFHWPVEWLRIGVQIVPRVITLLDISWLLRASYGFTGVYGYFDQVYQLFYRYNSVIKIVTFDLTACNPCAYIVISST